VIERLPDRMKTPVVARAITSPSAFLVAGAGMSLAVIAGVPLALAAIVGLACWGARVALAVPRKPKQPRVDLSGLVAPWHDYVQDAMLAQAHFEQALREIKPGPLHDRLAEVGTRIGDGVRECTKVARRGQDLDMAMMTIDVRRIQAEIAECQTEQQKATTAGQPVSPTLQQTMTSLQAQLASAQRVQSVGADARERLRLLNAQLDEAVAQIVELSVKGGDLADTQPLTANVESVVGELEALRQGLDAVGGGRAQSGEGLTSSA
jgi:hypothetical protein